MTAVEWRADGVWLLVRTPFNEDYVSDLKDSVPPHSRMWMPAPAKCWRVHKSYRDDVHRLVLAYFNVDLGEPQPSKQAREGRGASDAFTPPNSGNAGTRDGVAALAAQLREAQSQNARLDMAVRVQRQQIAALESQLAMAQAGRSSNGNEDSFSVRMFLRMFGARGFKSLVRVAHPDLNADNKADAEKFTKDLTRLAAEMGLT